MDLAFSRLTQLAFGYWHAQPLFSLSALGVFELLAEGGRTGEEIARRAGIDAEAAARLLCAGVAVGLLRLEAGRFWNAELAARFLVGSSPESLAHWVRVMGRWTGPWSRMDEALRAGGPVEDQALRLGEDPAYLEDFILGMHEYARRTAPRVARAIVEAMGANGAIVGAMGANGAIVGAMGANGAIVEAMGANGAIVEAMGANGAIVEAMGAAGGGPVGRVRRLVDVGGGAGTYSIALCEVLPGLHVRILDLEPVLAVTRRILAAGDLVGRIELEAADYRRDPFGEGVDAVLLSNVLHQEAGEVGLDMLRRARAALAPGGCALVHGHFLGEDRCRPAFSALHNLSALALWEGGRGYTTDEAADLMQRAGFEGVTVRMIPEAATALVVGWT